MTPPARREAVLITGAAKRLGRVIALHLAARGYDIALHYHTSEANAKRTADEICGQGVDCALFQADLAQLEALPELISEAHARFPRLAHLVNNAAVFERAPFLESTPADFTRDFTVNFAAPAFLTQAFAKAVLAAPPAPPGLPYSVTNLLDAKVDATRHGYFFYLLSKKALRDFTAMAAAELAPRIRVQAVYPPKVLPNAKGDDALPVLATPEAVAEEVWRGIVAENW